MIEHDVFKRKTIRFEELEKFGFIRINDGYLCKRKIFDGMLARVVVNEKGEVSGDVYDEELGEVYVNHRLEDATGAFVTGVRNAYLAFLNDIAEKISYEKTYIGDQANRINDFFLREYGVAPEFMWKKFPHFGVYRNSVTRKWIAIIMNIDKAKVSKGESGEVEVMNLKLDDQASTYLGKGVYPSYHMNHKSWVSVILDESVSDDIIERMIGISYKNSFPKTKRTK